MSISEIKVGTIVKVKVGRNIVPAKVIEILEDGFRVSSVAKNKEFVVTASRIVITRTIGTALLFFVLLTLLHLPSSQWDKDKFIP